jgi:serine/threonine protein phosphatase PrpC
VENEGGTIKDNRVHHPVWNGSLVNLGVTRCLGAPYFKLSEYTEGSSSGIIAEPDIFTILLRLSDEFIILASDGFWDVVKKIFVFVFVFFF